MRKSKPAWAQTHDNSKAKSKDRRVRRQIRAMKGA